MNRLPAIANNSLVRRSWKRVVIAWLDFAQPLSFEYLSQGERTPIMIG